MTTEARIICWKYQINIGNKYLSILPGEVKNVLANSSVALSRISWVIWTIRPINGGTR
jgi:hypothetical protein